MTMFRAEKRMHIPSHHFLRHIFKSWARIRRMMICSTSTEYQMFRRLGGSHWSTVILQFFLHGDEYVVSLRFSDLAEIKSFKVRSCVLISKCLTSY